MLTIDEYIAKMKKSDKLDEFDYSKLSENMSAVMKYVMSYFNDYLTMDVCDAEAIKIKHTVDKLEEDIANKYPKSKEFILNFYLQHKIRIYKELDKWVSDIPYFEFFYTDQDFSKLASGFCANYKLKGIDMAEYHQDIAVLASEIKKYNTEGPSLSEMIHLDNNIVSWVRGTYRQYGVNLYAFASDLAFTYYERYVKYEYGSSYGERGYYVNNYNHRYNNNPFDIEQIYEDNKHRPFLEDKRGELEMLVMYEWLFTEVHDDDYWPEYVNLCISRGRVNIVENVNALIPAHSAGQKYPDDVSCSIEHIVSSDGILKKSPQGEYIFRVDVSQTLGNAWQSIEDMKTLAESLSTSIKEHGTPKILELTAPMEVASFDEDIFLSCCYVIEKKMKKYSPMKVAIVNGPGNQRTKPVSHICTIEDIIKLKTQLRERKIHIQFSIDFPALLSSKKDTKYDQSEIFGVLTEIKNSILCLNVTNVKPQLRYWPKSRTLSDGTDVYYLNKYKYPLFNDFYTMLSATFNDNQKRYLIPKNISNNTELEVLVDNLLRSGFAFCSGGEVNG